jgi:hypothetical protein
VGLVPWSTGGENKHQNYYFFHIITSFFGAYPPEEKLPFFFPPISSGPPIFSRSSPAGQQYPIANAKKILEVAGARQTFQLNIPNTIHGSKCRL